MGARASRRGDGWVSSLAKYQGRYLRYICTCVSMAGWLAGLCAGADRCRLSSRPGLHGGGLADVGAFELLLDGTNRTRPLSHACTRL